MGGSAWSIILVAVVDQMVEEGHVRQVSFHSVERVRTTRLMIFGKHLTSRQDRRATINQIYWSIAFTSDLHSDH